MAKYTGIAEVSKKMAERLLEQLVPEMLPDGNGICLCSPDDRKAATLGIFLYDIRESEEVRRSGMVNVSPGKQAFPPMYMTLYYMITAYAASDLKFRMVQEQQILGKVVQYFHDNPILPLNEVDPEGAVGTDLHIQMLSLTSEEKVKLWNFGNQPYRLSLFYKISPLAIESARVKDITRVTEVNINLQSMQNKEERKA